MPSGNLVKSGCRLPAASRLCCIQQSSMFTYWYPAAARPDDTILSAVCLTSASDTLQPYAFQSFQPIGGVTASPFCNAWAGVAVTTTTAAPTDEISSSVARTSVNHRRILYSLRDARAL